MIFEAFDFKTGKLCDLSSNEYPTLFHAWTENDALSFEPSDEPRSFFGYIFKGETTLTTASNVYSLKTGQYFCVHDLQKLSRGEGIVIESLHYKGLNLIGGPIEPTGRLQYIDGCTDSLLAAPVKMGDPCLNALYFPPGIQQTAHTHPSFRLGIVASGRGECLVDHQKIALEPGMIFKIHENGLHCFHTGPDSSMTVIAYHPDSDYGPQDEDHPMINRTYIEGVSASKLNPNRNVSHEA